MRDGEWVRFVIRFEVLDADRFCEMARAMVAVSRDEPGTVVYDWYFDDQAGKGTLYEAYASAKPFTLMAAERCSRSWPRAISTPSASSP